jgi:hypothetical protein
MGTAPETSASVLTLQNFINKHIVDLENVQAKKKNEKD